MAFTTYVLLAEQVERRVGKLTDDSKLKRQEVIRMLKQRVAWRVAQYFFQAKNTDVATTPDGLVIPFKDREVLYDDVMQQYYTELPSSTLDLIYGMGIKGVSPTKQPGRSYIPVKNGFEGLYEGLDSSGLQNRIGYRVENDRLYFVNMTASNNPPTVIIKILAPTEGIDDSAPLNIPTNMQSDVIMDCVQIFAPQPIDKTNDT